MSHELSRSQINDIYKKKVAPIYLLCCRPQEFPQAVITGGQPGSGKSKLAERAVLSFLPEGCVVIDADTLRQDHPDYDQLARSNDKTVDDLTNDLAKRLVRRLFENAVETHRNLILDQTSRGAKGVEDSVGKMRSAGYHIEMHMIAAPAAITKLRIYQRYEEKRASRDRGRFTKESVHDGAYLGLPQTVAAVEDKCLVDRLCIYDYKQRLIYENSVEDGKWKFPPAAQQTFEAERERPLTPKELTELVACWKKLLLIVNMPGRNESEEYKAIIKAHYKEAVKACFTGPTDTAITEAKTISNPNLASVFDNMEEKLLQRIICGAISQFAVTRMGDLFSINASGEQITQSPNQDNDGNGRPSPPSISNTKTQPPSMPSDNSPCP